MLQPVRVVDNARTKRGREMTIRRRQSTKSWQTSDEPASLTQAWEVATSSGGCSHGQRSNGNRLDVVVVCCSGHETPSIEVCDEVAMAWMDAGGEREQRNRVYDMT